MKKVILITGGSSGIGKSIGTFLHEKGNIVYGTSRNPENISNSVFELLQLDVRDVESIKKCVNQVIQKSGRIDVLINNAGVGITGPLEEIPTEEIMNNFQTNLFGPIEVMKAVLPQMRQQKSGLIINVTSIAGYMGLPFRGVYSASKGALELITESLRMEVKQFGIQITNVAPGDFATDIASRRFHAPLIQGSAYEKSYGKTLEEINSHVDSGSNPIEMAEAIHKIMQTSEPKIHYKVGAFMQKFSIFLKFILPDLMFEKMLMKHYKL
ncbi:SDR family oxidoreductase [Flavobacterium sp. HXWNR69]|jgi:NAD(P)-dependent dehydrogenase (short-subunit alcohol dehydrogenase family)|uniref:SDR family oxidoreductase n=1 Tax=Flavobacterium fragile TaxID=2949085 RepID=A0ABT0TGY5_9FLAO|nr:SDR family oxidoreductase [Flavobacterium sp. HXWNR69]MBV2195604.1 SDR family oxidoreductase [Flavobacterium sp.]MCL9770229.1 SDR family oxidoreductase [Flavobacterium sp. HXWNR69]